MKTMLKESVFCNEQNQVEMIFSNELELDALDEMLTNADVLFAGMRKDKLAPRLLVDVTLLKKLSSPSRQRGTNWILNNQDLRIAVYGKNTFMKHFVNFLIIATRKSSSMKFFKTRKAAAEWLNN